MTRFGTVFAFAAAMLVGTSLVLADDQKTPIAGGIEGKVKSVDTEAKTLTITTAQGRDRTFTITGETTMVGPRGGKVRRGLKDPRFRDPISVTVVSDGNTATEIHLGYDRHGGVAKTAPVAPPDKSAGKQPAERAARKPAPPADTEAQPEKKVATGTKAAEPPAADEDEFPGQIKSFQATRRILVVTLLNGNERSFIVPKNVKVLVNGAASKRGLQDPALQNGASIDVVTDQGGRKVTEIKITPATAKQRKRAS